MQKEKAKHLLENGLSANLGYGDGYLIEEFFEKFDTNCHEISLIPLLKEIASRWSINFQPVDLFDDNGAGGFLHPTESGKSFKTEALEAINIINTNFEKLSPTAKKLISDDAKELELTLNEIIQSDSDDLDLIPFLAKIVQTDSYLIPNVTSIGFKSLSKTILLGKKAEKAIAKIKENVKDLKYKPKQIKGKK